MFLITAISWLLKDAQSFLLTSILKVRLMKLLKKFGKKGSSIPPLLTRNNSQK